MPIRQQLPGDAPADEISTTKPREMGRVDPARLVAESMILAADPDGTDSSRSRQSVVLHVPSPEWIEVAATTWCDGVIRHLREAEATEEADGDEEWLTTLPGRGRRRNGSKRDFVMVLGRTPDDRNRDGLAEEAWRCIPMVGVSADPQECLPPPLLRRARLVRLVLPEPEEVRVIIERLTGERPGWTLPTGTSRALNPDAWRLACEAGIGADAYQARLAAAIADEVTAKPTSVAPTTSNRGVVVVGTIGNDHLWSAREVRDGLKGLIGATLTLIEPPDLEAARVTLVAEFPHLAEVIEGVLADVAGQSYTWFRPVLLLGSPGTGKTRMARRLMEVLGLAPVLYSCAGVADASLAGTARRWSSAEPCLPMAQIMATGVANPGIVLDELEKASTTRDNGAIVDAMLSLLERETARRHVDPYVQAPVDLSRVCWVATANDAATIPAPLRDRFRVVRVPAPGAAHLVPLAQALMRDALAERGRDTAWARPLDGEELGVLSEVWRGGSLRSLARYVGAILEARDRPHSPKH